MILESVSYTHLDVYKRQAPDDINAFQPKAFMQVDWSRGGDAVIVKRGINLSLIHI